MPIYFNDYVSIRGSYSNYHSGVMRRTYVTKGPGHFEAPIDVSSGIIRHIGCCSFNPGLTKDFSVQEDSMYDAWSVVARGSKSEKLTTVVMDLYTVRRSADLTERDDAILVRKIDLPKIEVISGGGYDGQQRRRYDNIIFKVSGINKVQGVLVVIQPHRSDKFQYGDRFYRITNDGVTLRLYGITGMDACGGISEDIPNDWAYI